MNKAKVFAVVGLASIAYGFLELFLFLGSLVG
jgi:hypothetical protein